MTSTSFAPHRAWIGTLLAGSAAIAAYFLISSDAIQSGLYALIGSASAILILIASRNITLGRAAWRCFGVALLMWSLGDLTYTLIDLSGSTPYPSIADVLYILGYPFAIAGVVIYVASRRPGSVLRSVMDGTLISIPIALIAWELVVARYVSNAELSTGDLFGLSYPLLDLVLFGAACALIVNPRPRADTRLLGGALALLVFADVVYSAGLLAGTYRGGIWYDAGWLFSYVLWAAAALHPSAKAKPREIRAAEHGDAHSLFALAAGALLIAAYMFDYLRGDEISLPLAILGGGATMLLAIGRMGIEVRHSRLNEDRVQDQMDHASDAIFIVSDRRYTDVNEAACTMTGYSRGELLAMDLGLLNPLDQLGLLDELFAKVEAGEPVTAERDLLRKDGSWVTIESHTRQLPDGRVQSIVRDMSARIEAERALRESEEMLRHAFDSGSSGMALADLNGGFIKVNNAFADMLGFEPKDLVGTAIVAVTHADDRDTTIEQIERMTRGDINELNLEKRYVHRDGHEVWARVDLALRRDANGSPTMVVAHILDISRSRELESRLRQADKMDAIGWLAGGVAHDFNNLLGVVLNYSGFVAEELGPDHVCADDVQEVIKAGRRGAALTRQLLTFSRKDIPTTEVLLINDTVSELEPMLRKIVQENIELSIQLDPAIPEVAIDPTHLDQILMNLVVNAKDAMLSGGVLTISTSDLTLAAASKELGLDPGHYAIVRVSDTGVGMNEDVLAHIFEPFFTTKGRDKGTGLGLATLYTIVSQAGGAIDVESQAGLGTTVDILLPAYLDDADVEAVDLPPTGISPEMTALDLLVVEDDPSIRAVTSRILRSGGHNVVEAEDGAEALRLLEGATFDVLVSDIVMPGMSGLELRQRVDLPAVLMSGYPDDVIHDQGELPSGTALVMKPFTPAQLLEAVSNAATHSAQVGGRNYEAPLMRSAPA